MTQRRRLPHFLSVLGSASDHNSEARFATHDGVELRDRAGASRRMPICLMVAASLMAGNPGPLQAQRADTTVVNITGPLNAAPATLVEQFTVGRGSSAAEYSFTIVRIWLAANGGIFLSDAFDNVALDGVVHQYDSAGRHVRQFARNGDGPGEFRGFPGDFAQLADGRILMSTPRGINVYSAQGTPTGAWSAKSRFANLGSEIMVDPAGFIYTGGARTVVPGSGASRPSIRKPILYRFTMDGSLIDTVLAPGATFPALADFNPSGVPYMMEHLTAWSPLGYFVTANPARYAIDLRLPPTPPSQQPRSAALWNPGSGRVVSLRREVPVIPVSSEERADWRQSITMLKRTFTPTWQWEGPDVPTVKQPISLLLVQSDGRIWVRRSQPSQLVPSVRIPTEPLARDGPTAVYARLRWIERPVYDVLEPNGRFVGQVQLPQNTSVFTARGDTIWVVLQDEFDVPSVKKYLIRWGG